MYMFSMSISGPIRVLEYTYFVWYSLHTQFSLFLVGYILSLCNTDAPALFIMLSVILTGRLANIDESLVDQEESFNLCKYLI